MNQTEVTYIEEVDVIVMSFRFEFCSNCLCDLDRHLIGPDPLGHAHLFCLEEEL